MDGTCKRIYILVNWLGLKGLHVNVTGQYLLDSAHLLYLIVCIYAKSSLQFIYKHVKAVANECLKTF